MHRNLLLVSSSSVHPTGYLDHCEPQIREFLNGVDEVLFVPYARPSGKTHDEYTAIASERFQRLGKKLRGIHTFDNPAKAVSQAGAIFVGGGNTFVLLDQLYESEIVNEMNYPTEAEPRGITRRN